MNDEEFMKQRCYEMSITELEKAINIKRKAERTFPILEEGQIWEKGRDIYILAKVDIKPNSYIALYTLQRLNENGCNRYYEPMALTELKEKMLCESKGKWEYLGNFNDVFKRVLK